MTNDNPQILWRLDKEELYTETVTSNWTHSLFLGVMFLCMFAFMARIKQWGVDALSLLLLFLFAIFLFYLLNYRRLQIHITREAVWLKFGLFSRMVAVENMADAQIDELPDILRYGGAGIHFFFARGRYRVSFNFLEHPRVVIALRVREGWVRDVSFSTRRAEQVSRILRDLIASQNQSR
jgi:Ca2+/Na+ antiporter